MSSENCSAILVIAHGSRLEEANADLAWLAGAIQQRCPDTLVELAYLEIAEPDILTAGTRCVDQGATRVVLLPYFLSPGRHAAQHLSEYRDELSLRFPTVTFELRQPLGRHPGLVDVVIDRLSPGEPGPLTGS